MPTTSIPLARNAAGLVYDVARQETVMFGGAKDGTVNGGLNDTWTWDGINWTQKTPATVPPTRTYPGMSFDLARGVVVMFGGRIHGGPAGPSGVQNDTWEWNGVDWTQINVSNPPAPRYSCTMAYDVARGVHVMFSGVSGSNASFNDTWEYDGAAQTWTQITTTNSPGGRVYAAMAYDFSRQRIVVYGGADDTFTIMPDVFWEYDGSDWTPVVPATTPGPAQGHTMAYDVARQRVVIQGGQTSGRAYRIGTWEYDGVHCYHFGNEPNPGPPSWNGSSAFDIGRSRTIVFGGYSGGNNRSSDIWERDPAHPGFSTFGLGCSTTSAVPELQPRTLPALGTTLVVDIVNLPSSGPVSMLFGVSNKTWPAGPLPLSLDFIGWTGCTLYTSVEALMPVTNAGGSASWSLPVPNVSTLRGAMFYLQALAPVGTSVHMSDAGEGRLW